MSTRQPDAAAGGRMRAPLLFAAMAALIVLEGLTSGWNGALVILNMGLISAVIALGLNMQWGYAGLFNSGVVGFIALGGLAGNGTAAPSRLELRNSSHQRSLLIARRPPRPSPCQGECRSNNFAAQAFRQIFHNLSLYFFLHRRDRRAQSRA